MPGGTEENYKKPSARMVNVLAEIQTKYHVNASPEDYCHTNQLSAKSENAPTCLCAVFSASFHRFKDKIGARIF
jgi:hypothetical protein